MGRVTFYLDLIRIMAISDMDAGQDEQRAFDLYLAGEFALAQSSFMKLAQATSSKALKDFYQFNVASCLAAQDNHNEALKNFVEVECSGDDLLGLYNMALCLCELGQYDLALVVVDRLLDQFTSSKSAPDLAGRDLLVQGDLDLERIIRLLMRCMEGLSQHNLSHGQCQMLESILNEHKSKIIELSDELQWTKNMAHVLFLMDTRFADCLKLYESILIDGEQEGLLLKNEPQLLSNLCVSYILTGRNRDAEELIKDVERAAEVSSGGLSQQPLYEDRDQDSSQQITCDHLTHLNMAIGTLYCVKNNYDFGLTRLLKSLEPVDKKLTSESWAQAKRCILSALDRHCKQLIHLRDELLEEMVTFLMKCEAIGIHITTSNPKEKVTEVGKNSVTCEARHLRALLLAIIHD